MDWSSSLDKDLHDTTQTQSNLRDILQGYGRSQAAHQQRTKSNTPIPDDGLVGSDGRSVQLDGLGTAVQSHGALGDTNVNSSGTHLTILTEFAGSDEPAAALLVAQGETYRSLPVLRWFTMSYNPRPIADCRLFPSGSEQSAVRGFFTVL